MSTSKPTRRMWIRALGAGLSMGVLGRCNPALASTGADRLQPNEVLPLSQLPPQTRERVAEIIQGHQIHRRGDPDTFPANPRIYLHLLNDPVLTLALWQDLSATPARLQQLGPNLYSGTDGSGTTATWQYILRSTRLHALTCDLDYASPRGAARLNGRLLLIVRSGYFREVNGEFWVQHEIEVFVKVDSKGWRALAATLRPVIEGVLKDQVSEAGWFVSLMARLVEMYPNWAVQTVQRQPHIAPEARAQFAQLIEQTRREGAFDGRPVVADARQPGNERR